MDSETLNQVVLILKELTPLLVMLFGSAVFLFSLVRFIDHFEKKKIN